MALGILHWWLRLRGISIPIIINIFIYSASADRLLTLPSLNRQSIFLCQEIFNVSIDFLVNIFFPYQSFLFATILFYILGDPEVTANIYCKSRNLPNTYTQNYSTDLRYLLGHPVHSIRARTEQVQNTSCISWYKVVSHSSRIVWSSWYISSALIF